MWVNNPLCLTFGFNRSELMGKSVSMLMPSPLAEMHSQLVRRYVTSGEERLINKQLEHMVLNRAKQVRVLSSDCMARQDSANLSELSVRTTAGVRRCCRLASR